MKAGTETGSLTNHLMSGGASPDPVVGMGGTILQWTDRRACTVSAILAPDAIEVRDDKATRTDSNGMSDAQSYAYETDPAGAVTLFKRHRDGTWRQAMRSDAGRIVWVDRGRGERLRLGVRRHYHDFTF